MAPALIALFAVYTLAVAWQARRALSTADPALRLREAVRLLILATLGVPLVIALMFVA